MPPLPANSTNRLFVDYLTGNETGSQQHTTSVRYNPVTLDVGDVQEAFLDVLQGIGAALFRTGWRVVGTRVQAAGSDISLPVTTIVSLAGFTGTASPTYTPRLEAVEMTFQGRSSVSGRSVDFSLYTAVIDVGPNFRYASGDVAAPWVATALAALRAGTTAGAFQAISGDAPIWYDYVNLNYNSYWERRLRTV